MTIRIILADDHQLFREGIRVLLESVNEYQVISEADNAEDLKTQVVELQPDLVIQDYRMPGGGTISTLEYIKKRYPKIKVIALTGVHSGSLFQQLLDSHADGVLLKEISAQELLTAVRNVLRGEKVFSSTVREQVFAGKPDLSPREFQVLDLVVEGLNNNEISERLNLSPKTIENHRYNLMNKLGVRNAVELMHYVRKNGLLDS